jgi:hypothetical protein
METTDDGARPQPSERMVTEIAKNSREVLRIMLQTFKGYELVSVRVWFRDREGDVLKPGKNGLTMRVEKLPELQEAIGKAIEAARREGTLR